MPSLQFATERDFFIYTENKIPSLTVFGRNIPTEFWPFYYKESRTDTVSAEMFRHFPKFGRTLLHYCIQQRTEEPGIHSKGVHRHSLFRGGEIGREAMRKPYLNPIKPDI